MADGRSVYAIARQLQTGARTVNDALRRHGLRWPPADADPVDRLAYIDDDEIRGRSARRIIDEATALAARALEHGLASAVRGSELVVDPDQLYDLERIER